MVRLFESLKELVSKKSTVKLVPSSLENLFMRKSESLNSLAKPKEKEDIDALVRSTSETLSMIQSKAESLKPISRLEDSDDISKDDLRIEIEALMEADRRALELFSQLMDYNFKKENYTFKDILKKDIQSNQIDLSLIESNSSQIMLRNVYLSFYKRRISMEEYHKRIEERYQMTTVDPTYQYSGEKTENSHWREEATTLFSGIDLTPFTDLQLKYYVVALRTMPNSASIIREAMNPMRSAEHVRLLFNCLDDNAFAEVIKHPEYSIDKIVSMMPNLLEAIEENKKK